ncbi:BgTH12-04837 [Blumeria graminis f. sp. triticale]|nr:BgTH12-04837 [Blumeria graminis f. sp. triticale]
MLIPSQSDLHQQSGLSMASKKPMSKLPTHSWCYAQFHKSLGLLQEYERFIAPALILADALLCGLIISLIAYTEIDWKAYMEQIEQIVQGERDYTRIEGGTGPLVYPAAHVYLYWILYHLTSYGRNILLAQILFGVLYIWTIFLAISCYKKAHAPNYILPMLVLSKRLHSIFVLRLFNDCFAVFYMWAAIYLFQRRAWIMGSIIYSWALGIKMTLLLSLPALGVVFFLAEGIVTSLKLASLIALVQLTIAFPFLSTNAVGYFTRAFDFSRQFLYTWTVNWRFLGEDLFLSRGLSITLLTAHIMTLMFFTASRWLTPIDKPVRFLIQNALNWKEPCGKGRGAISARIGPTFILTTVLTANAIGFLFARSMHYQFYAYISLTTPFLLWRAGFHLFTQYILWALQEWAWNVYPSTNLSSIVVVGVQFLAVFGVWWNTGNEFVGLTSSITVRDKTL